MTLQEKCFELDGGFTQGMIDDMLAEQGNQFSDNYSATGSSLCLKVDVDSNTVYYQECYSRYGNFTGKNIYGNHRDDKLNHPTPGLKTMSLFDFYSKAFGWV